MTTTPTTDAAVGEFAGQLFFRLWRVTHTRTAEALGSLGLTTALFALLNVLGTREGAIQQELGAAMGVDPDCGLSGLVEAEAHPDAGNGLGTHAHLRYRTYDCVTNCVTTSSNTSAATRTCMDVIRRVTCTFSAGRRLGAIA